MKNVIADPARKIRLYLISKVHSYFCTFITIYVVVFISAYDIHREFYYHH